MLDPTQPCILFAGYRNAAGYGRKWRDGQMQPAHRVAYCDAHGVSLPSLGRLVVRHSCDNPGCVNPAHLDIGTHVDNMRDMDERGRRVNKPVRGEAHVCAKLTAAEVEEIRASTTKQRDIAAKYGVSQPIVSRIKSGKIWKVDGT